MCVVVERVGTFYGENEGMPLHWELHYELIFTWFIRIESLLPMWWLLTGHRRRWFRVSLIVVAELNVISKIRKYRMLHEGHHFILMAMEVHDALGMIWIILSRNVLALFMTNDRKVNYFCLFAFIFKVFLRCQYCFLACFSFYYREEDCFGGDACFRHPITF